MTFSLDVVDPPDCGAGGVPLDWKRCRCQEETSMGSLSELYYQNDMTCPSCGGHGSLKAAALAELVVSLHAQRIGESLSDHAERTKTVRCEGCEHPMSDGAWEDRDLPHREPDHEVALEYARLCLRDGREPVLSLDGVHWSPCDEGCRHGDPGRGSPNLNLRGEAVGRVLAKAAQYGVKPQPTFEASWREVDVRTLGHAHDLREHKLKILCLRCWARDSVVAT